MSVQNNHQLQLQTQVLTLPNKRQKKIMKTRGDELTNPNVAGGRGRSDPHTEMAWRRLKLECEAKIGSPFDLILITIAMKKLLIKNLLTEDEKQTRER